MDETNTREECGVKMVVRTTLVKRISRSGGEVMTTGERGMSDVLVTQAGGCEGDTTSRIGKVKESFSK